MLNGPALAQAIVVCQQHAVRVQSLLYRAIHLSWFDPFNTARPLFTRPGARSRFLSGNAAGVPEALYAAVEADTAFREFNQDYFQIAQTPAGAGAVTTGILRPEPGAVIGVHINASRLLDVRDVAIQNQLDTKLAELAAPWKASRNATPTQQLGEAIFSGNWFEGIVYESVQHPGFSCVVLFRQRLLATPSVHFQGYQVGGPARNPNSSLADAQLP